MKISKSILLLNAILEGLAGVVIIMRPGIIMQNGNMDSSHLALAKIYGIAAFTLGILSFQIWKNFSYSKFEKMVLLAFMVFHLLIGLQMYSFYSAAITPNPGAAVLHMVFAVLFAVAIIREKILFDDTASF